MSEVLRIHSIKMIILNPRLQKKWSRGGLNVLMTKAMGIMKDKTAKEGYLPMGAENESAEC